MKAVINGGLNLSTLDGWWAEAYDGTNGWALEGDVQADHATQDARDAAALYDLLEQEVLPTFYDRDADGLPHSWLARIRASMRTLAPAFCAGRMLEDYLGTVYEPTQGPAPEPTHAGISDSQLLTAAATASRSVTRVRLPAAAWARAPRRPSATRRGAGQSRGHPARLGPRRIG